jgi:hypothetical protein
VVSGVGGDGNPALAAGGKGEVWAVDVDVDAATNTTVVVAAVWPPAAVTHDRHTPPSHAATHGAAISGVSRLSEVLVFST